MARDKVAWGTVYLRSRRIHQPRGKGRGHPCPRDAGQAGAETAGHGCPRPFVNLPSLGIFLLACYLRSAQNSSMKATSPKPTPHPIVKSTTAPHSSAAALGP